MKKGLFGSNHSAQMHSETEIPGINFTRETLEIIRFRYDFASLYIKGKAVLEIGSSTGLGLKYLSRKAATVVGGEFSEENIRLCRELHGTKVTVVRMDAHRLPYPDCSFDVIVALAMVYCLRMDEFLAEATRVLRPNGLLLFCMSNKDVSGFVPAPYTEKYYSVPDLSNILRKAGFVPSFFGAFKAAGGSIFMSRARGIIKLLAKGLAHSIPGGKTVWLRIRRKTLGETFPLPNDISLIPPSDEKLILLEGTRKDFIHRVIYVNAQKFSVTND